MGNHVYKETGLKNLTLAGGVALNCVANGKLLREGPFENIWIQPAAGDAGGALVLHLSDGIVIWEIHEWLMLKPIHNSVLISVLILMMMRL